MSETIGKRIAFLRQKHGWTQATLAKRLAISRVAVSHIEMDLIVPSERTVTLLAGIFKLSPYTLVDGTTYPQAKVEHLPEVACSYTELELQLALLKNDIAWLRQLDHTRRKHTLIDETLSKWLSRLEEWELSCLDEHENQLLSQMSEILKQLKNLAGQSLPT
jgi:transcriptional regulator with XRE-family HTH domain